MLVFYTEENCHRSLQYSCNVQLETIIVGYHNVANHSVLVFGVVVGQTMCDVF